MHPHPVAADLAAAVARRDPQRLVATLTETARLRALLPAAAIVAHGRADVPTHLVVLVLAAASAFWLRRRGRVGSVQAWRVAFVAAIAQPAAHAYGSMLPRTRLLTMARICCTYWRPTVNRPSSRSACLRWRRSSWSHSPI